MDFSENFALENEVFRKYFGQKCKNLKECWPKIEVLTTFYEKNGSEISMLMQNFLANNI